MKKRNKKGVFKNLQKNLTYYFGRYSFLVVLFFNTAIPFYLLTHPGLLFSSVFSYPIYYPKSDAWISIFGLMVVNFAFMWIYRNNKLFDFTIILNVIYSLCLYFYPSFYFRYINMDDTVTIEGLIFSSILISLNIFVFCKYLKELKTM